MVRNDERKNMPPTLYLIDGHALAYRMYFALTAGGGSGRWQNSKGEPTAGITDSHANLYVC
ncbi:MAG: hypothetical protein HC797_06650 [Anaerolineales bacterium]|nr:hypothetical protein [Anaerolineales bacterium]